MVISSCWQLDVFAHEAATPQLQTKAVVYVIVKRNENKPSFSQSRYVANINATYPQGLRIVTISAEDKDGVRLCDHS